MTPFDEIARQNWNPGMLRPMARKLTLEECMLIDREVQQFSGRLAQAVMQATQKHVMERFWDDADNCFGPCPYCFENKFDLPECRADIARRAEEILKK